MKKLASLPWIARVRKKATASHGCSAPEPPTPEPAVPGIPDPLLIIAVNEANAKVASQGEYPRLELNVSAKKRGWTMLRHILKAVCDGSDAFPPLKSALSGVVSIMVEIECVNENQENFLELAQRIGALQKIIGVYYTAENSDSLPTLIQQRLIGISSAFLLVKDSLDVRTGRGFVARLLRTQDDIQAIQKVLRFVARLIEDLQIDTLLNTERSVEYIRSGVHNLHRANILEKLRHTPGAEYGSQSRKGCMAGTRVGILGDLLAWSVDPDAPQIFWLAGMAGTGKSAIAWSFAEMLDSNGLLGGTFFCLRDSADRSDVSRILPSLAVSFARRNAAYEAALAKALAVDPDAAHRTIDRQVDCLFRQPLTNKDDKSKSILIIDALDECSDESAVEQLLKGITSLVPHVPLKFLVTSRVEQHIRRRLGTHQPGLTSVLRLHDIDSDTVAADISCYLERRLEETRKDFEGDIYEFPATWPPASDVKIITRLSGKLFIYAFTAVEYVHQLDPIGRLQKLATLEDNASERMIERLADIYSHILSDSFGSRTKTADEVDDTKRVLSIILTVRRPISLSLLSQFLFMPIRHIRSLLDQLQAVIYVPPQDDVATLQPFHASFIDYVTKQAPESLRIDLADGHAILAGASLSTMQSHLLHFNVSRCPSSYVSNEKQQLAVIPELLCYASVHWAHHLVIEKYPKEHVRSLEEIMFKKALFWLEVLSAIGSVHTVSSQILKVLTVDRVRSIMPPKLVNFLRDINDFVITCRTAIESSIPHIYLSALPNAHSDSEVYKMFRTSFHYLPLIKVQSTGMRRSRGSLLHLLGHAWPISSLAVSPDGARIVSASDDGAMKVWDLNTGEITLNPLNGRTALAVCATFSPNGKRIIAGGSDGFVRVWDSVVGEQIFDPLMGHRDEVWAIATSPIGDRVVSVSADGCVRTWLSSSGELLAEFLIAIDSTRSESYFLTPNGSCVFAVTKAIRMWDVEAQRLILDIPNGHSLTVRCIVASPDGSTFCSGSEDRTIRVWCMKTSKELFEPLRGHEGPIYSVTYSPDGDHIASGSADCTIRIWNAKASGVPLMVLMGHSNTITSLVYSPDGRRIVSGSWDSSIRIWEAESCDVADAELKESQEHTGDVQSVRYTSDGSQIISFSTDGTIRFWDALSGCPSQRPAITHPCIAHAMSISPNGKKILLGSYDGKIRILGTETGEIVLGPLEGHTGDVWSVVFSPEGSQFASSSFEGETLIWNAETGELDLALPKLDCPVWQLAFTPDGKRLALCSDRKEITIWNLSTGQLAFEPLRGHRDTVACIAISADGKKLVSGSDDMTVRIWDVGTGCSLLDPLRGHRNTVQVVGFSPDGKYVASGSSDWTNRVWDAITGDLVVGPLENHRGGILDLAFSPSGKQLVSGSEDGTIMVWDLSLDTESAAVHSPSSPKPGGSSDQPLVSNNSEEDVRQWDVPTVDGWIGDSKGNVMLWLQPEYCKYTPRGRCKLVIPSDKVVIDVHDMVHGSDWSKCYIGDPA